MTVYRICSVCKGINDPADMKKTKNGFICRDCEKKKKKGENK